MTKHTSDLRGRVVHVNSGMAYDLYVGRANKRYGLEASFWANPFPAKPYGREYALERFEELQRHRFKINPFYKETIRSLRGKTLACWCAPKDHALTLDDSEVCHGQTLLRLAQELSDE